MAYKQKGFPMHSVSALKMDREPRMERRKETMRRDHGEYLDTSNPTTSREIESIERAIREPERDPMAEMRRKRQRELMDGPVKPPVRSSMVKGANISGAVPEDNWQRTVSEKTKAGIGYQTTYKRDKDGNIIESGITFDDGTYLPD
jgi:hypothetical protein